MASERRRKQIARQIQEKIAGLLLFEMKDPRASFVTVTGVDINRDLSVAKVRYTVYGDESDRSRVAHMLEHAHGFLRSQVAAVLKVRQAPQLEFHYDEGVMRADRIEQILRDVLPEGATEEGDQPAPPEQA